MSVAWAERPLPAGLRPWVASVWELRAGPEGSMNRVLPDGSVDLVWFAGGIEVAGANTTAFTVAMGPGERAGGVRLRPGAAPALLGVSGAAIRDRRVAPGDLWGRAGRELAARGAESVDPLALLLAWLTRRAADATAPDPVVLAAAALLEGTTRTREVAATIGRSERHLRRRVTDDVGYGPKRLGRVLRLQRALALARAPGAELAGVAAASGYADQSHLTRDCTALAGVPPGALLTVR